ncbi:MAG: DcrB-related protein [Myxococcales bacterium]|nr:DcrB-related protein [Myxococcales bacterium]
MSSYRYHADEFAISIPAAFVDKSVTLLEWPLEDGPVAVVVRRKKIAEDGEFARTVEAYFRELKAKLQSFREEAPISFECSSPYAALACRYREEQHVLYQIHVAINLGTTMLFFIWNGQAAQKSAVEELARSVMSSFLYREADG